MARRSPSRDDGFTLIEVIVAIGLLMMMAASVTTLMLTAIHSYSGNKFRTEASYLATRELEIVRDQFTSPTQGPLTVDTNEVVNPDPLPGQNDGDPLTVDGVPYTVVRDAEWSAVGQAGSTCDNQTNSALAYLHVRVLVTWPGMSDSTPPTTIDTLLTAPRGTYSDNSGHIGIKVIDRAGNPEQGVTVNVINSSGVNYLGATSADGCAVFAYMTPGTYTVKLDTQGYVDIAGNAPSVTTAYVQPGSMFHATISYDQSATIQAQFVTAPGFNLPVSNNIPLSLGNAALTPGGVNTVAGSGNPRTVNNLWPYASGYQIWAGNCIDNDPQQMGSTRDLPTASDPGGTSTTNVELAPITVTNIPGGATVYATDSADSSCQSGQTIVLGTGSGGTLNTSLPYGTWTVRVTSSGRTGSATLDPSDLTSPDTVPLS